MCGSKKMNNNNKKNEKYDKTAIISFWHHKAKE